MIKRHTLGGRTGTYSYIHIFKGSQSAAQSAHKGLLDVMSGSLALRGCSGNIEAFLKRGETMELPRVNFFRRAAHERVRRNSVRK